ncbi:MAG: T9SS type A sorting domain-containing protein [Bacteroidales bacterium]|nr:T9SS type A sorting domain-containing protein [Bacteroidales bacterium]MCF8455273.1 T9SS type A sorting domain-containing protein [Bacteroidales bacterium]
MKTVIDNKRAFFFWTIILFAVSVVAQNQNNGILKPLYPSHSSYTGNDQTKELSETYFADDIKMNEIYITFWAWDGTNYIPDGFYSNRPVNQIMPISFSGDIWNIGTSPQTNVKLNTQITDNGGVIVYEQSDSITGLGVSGTVQLIHPDKFTPGGPNVYTVAMSCSQDQIDMDPANNLADLVQFEISENKSISRYHTHNDKVSPEDFGSGQPGDFVGIQFWQTATDTVKSLSFFIDPSSNPGTYIKGLVYVSTDSTINDMTMTDEYEIQSTDLGQWVELPMLWPILPYNILTEGKQYIAGAELYYGNNESIYLGSDNSSLHDFEVSAVVRLSTDWFWFYEIPMVMVNFDFQTLSAESPGKPSIEDIQVYPNPFSSIFYVEINSGIPEIDMFSVLGRKMDVEIEKDGNIYSIPSTGYSSGIYILKISFEGKVYSRKIVK